MMENTKMIKKIKAMEIIINEFLESDSTPDKLRKDLTLMTSLKTIFTDAYFQGGDNLMVEKKLKDFVIPPYNNYVVKHLFGGGKIQTKPISFEEKLFENRNKLISIWKKFKGALKYKSQGIHPSTELCSIDIKLLYSGDYVHYAYDEIVLIFIALLKGLPINVFRKCQRSECETWFASIKSNKKYCSPKCSSKVRMKKYLKNNRNEYNEYHRKHENKLYRKKMGLKPLKAKS